MSISKDEVWLTAALEKHTRLAPLTATLLENLIREKNIEFLSVTHRTKTLKGALDKIERKEYSDAPNQMTDFSGIRVVTYLEKQVVQIAELIRDSFEIDDKNSLDKRSELGSDRVGYRSFHFVCSLGAKRDALPEYTGISELKFEIQVRTVLQHAWAELAHDNSFKADVALPAEIQRKLNLHAAMLEIVDGAFQEIFDSVTNYRESLSKASPNQISKQLINSLSLSKYVSDLIKKHSQSSIRENLGADAIREAAAFDVKTVGDFARLCTADFVKDYFDNERSEHTTTGFVRSVLMYEDLDKYLSSPHSWTGLSRRTFEFLAQKYGEEEVKRLLKLHEHNLLNTKTAKSIPRPRKAREPRQN